MAGRTGLVACCLAAMCVTGCAGPSTVSGPNPPQHPCETFEAATVPLLVQVDDESAWRENLDNLRRIPAEGEVARAIDALVAGSPSRIELLSDASAREAVNALIGDVTAACAGEGVAIRPNRFVD